MSRFTVNLVLATSCLVPAAAGAQEVAEIPFALSPPGSAALGAGLRIAQIPYFASASDDQVQLDLVPLYLYEGKWLYAHGSSGGLYLLRNDSLRLSLYTRYRFQQLDPDSHKFYEGLEERRQSLDAGTRAQLIRDWGELRLTWLTDTLDRHNGEEVQLAYRYRFDAGPWSFSPFVSWTWQDADLTNYYFGVSADEARPDRPEYTPGASEWFGFGLNTAWFATDRIELFANVVFSGADSAVTNSPLVEDSSFSQLFVGGSYRFGNVRQAKYVIDPEREGEWSWRVNYGYQAEGNIVGEIDQGDFSKSPLADTTIGGLTVGRLLADGPRVDFLGRFAFFRHFEEDEDNGNFWSYAAYIAAEGRGYSPWSKQEIFRWTFGFGMSYADTIPIAEQRKQTGEGSQGNTAHFLNYLEMTLDFPLRRVSKVKWLQRCYAGLTVVHRSGIFGTSDILGDVSGGSDWVTAHLECIR